MILLRTTREATEEAVIVPHVFRGVGAQLHVEGLRDRCSDETLHMYIIKHDPFGPAKVVVGVSIALHALLLALSRRRHLSSKTKSRPPRGPRSASQT